MSRLPGVRNELVAAAERRRDPLRAPGARAARSRVVLLGAGLAVAMAGTAAAVVVGTGGVGQRPSTPVPRVKAEEQVGMRRTRAPVVLGTTALTGGARVELIGYRMRGYRGRGDLLCLDLAITGQGRPGSCDTALPRRAAGTFGLQDERGRTTARLALGATTGSVSAVVVAFEAGGRRRRVRAQLLRVPERVASALAAPAFTYYLAELPPTARPERAVAYGKQGQPVWSAEIKARRR